MLAFPGRVDLVTSTRIDDALARLQGTFVEMSGSELTDLGATRSALAVREGGEPAES